MEILLRNLQKTIPIPRDGILKAAKTALLKLHLKPAGLSIVFAGTRRMRSLNRKYLGHDYATDVLTFDLGEGNAEIIICPRVAHANARRLKTSTRHELLTYAVHGILHLAGYDDATRAQRSRMRRMEERLLP